ncbi:HK97 gp10 family phage protein [Streptomyces europaeiscabiei]|uniref:HK97 gp10 family phage protein n=1 Tax=Streptomyces europaeiscabiei TaxID=146819 RepID=A0ABU4N992_9ACTN|nr:HK97-gp10 family putative phage morphogenesis protein [Streptomyces europaeiscabiei]MDX3550982.1 HK97 gp10 family phage protein [Streptomyces europaeiscabiei]MDX3698458.1 HK97 gp10 family phage protein [Streptomyces europaeiscabiei]
MSSVRGLRTALRRLRILPGRINDMRDEALDKWAADIEKTAKDMVPKRTRKLHDSIEARVNRGTGKAWIQIKAGPTREYAYYVEKGTSKMQDQPFMGPAAQLHRRSGERALREAAPRFLSRW